MGSNDAFYIESINCFNQKTKRTSQFLEKNDSFCDEIKNHLKTLYDFTKNEEIKKRQSSALSELIIKDFDLEQIWQQIELQNDPLLANCLPIVSKLVVAKDRLNLKKDLPKEEIDSQEEGNSNGTHSDEEIEVENEGSSEEDLAEQSGDEDVPRQVQKKELKSSIVDDEFFKLDEMEHFLNVEEKKLNDPDSGNDSENSDEESESVVDLFEAQSEDEEEKMKTARYKDFFIAKDEVPKKTPRNKFLDELGDNEEQPKSSFEERQARLNKKIEQLEEKAVQEKPWQLKGEITAEDRPPNALLEEVVEFDLSTRPAPVVTEQTTFQLEDIIKQRIKDKVFDSVERKAKPVETPLEYKKKLVLDQEKSKESLAQIYEKAYLEQQEALDANNEEKEEKEPLLHQEINSMMKSLFTKLDALSNFHFTPKPAIPDLKIVSNLPAISMEEVAPVGTSDANLLAPEEVKSKIKGDLMNKNERTTTDKKRERRKKKLKQKIHAKRKVEVEKSKSLGNKYDKKKAKKMLEKVTKDKNVDQMDQTTDAKNVKSSKAFFTQLQEEVKTQLKRKASDKQSPKNRNKFNAKKLKL